MARTPDVRLFVVRGSTGTLRVTTAEGAVVVEAATWRQLRHDLRAALAATGSPRVAVLVGRPVPEPMAAKPLSEEASEEHRA